MNSRIEKLRNVLAEQHLDALFVSSLSNIAYLTNFSGFGTEDRDAFLLITQDKQYIFTHGIYREVVEKEIQHFELIPMLREKPLNDSIKMIIDEQQIKHLGFEAFDLTVNEYDRLTKNIDKKILEPSDVIAKLRMIKTAEEIQAIHKACKLGDKAYEHIVRQLKAGITEKEIALELAFFIKKNGADLSFPSIVAFGANASKPHHVANETKLKPDTIVLFDFGVRQDNYCSDMTRPVVFGKASLEQKKVYKIVFDSQQKAFAFLQERLKNNKPVLGKDVDAIARNYIMDQGFASIPHSLGHGIGLEVHESPRLTILSEEQMQNGMVFSIEPGIYLRDKFGIRIEDLFAIQNNELIQLTNASKLFIAPSKLDKNNVL